MVAFFSNEQTFDSVDNIQTTLNTVVQDSSNYLRDTTQEVDDILCQAVGGDGVIIRVVEQINGEHTGDCFIEEIVILRFLLGYGIKWFYCISALLKRLVMVSSGFTVSLLYWRDWLWYQVVLLYLCFIEEIGYGIKWFYCISALLVMVSSGFTV